MTKFPNSTHPAENGKRKMESRKRRYVFFVFVFVRSYGQPMSRSACMDYAVGHATEMRLFAADRSDERAEKVQAIQWPRTSLDWR